MATSRVKDAGFLQQHLEKLVLAAGVFVLVVAVFLFVFGNPFSIEVGGQTYANANDATEVLERTDDQLESGLRDPKPIPDTPIPQFYDNYQAMIVTPVISPNPIARLASSGLTQSALNPKLIQPPRYAMVYPPAPKEIEYKFGYDVLDTEFNPQVVNAFFDMWGGKREPADFPMIVVAGEFDIWEWVNRLKGEDDAKNKIPLGIWTKRFGIAGVALLREEWNEESGIWTNRQIVKPLPTQARMLPTDDAPTDPLLALQRIEQLRVAQSEIAQPELPWVIDFVQITAPGSDELQAGADGFDQFGIPIDDKNLGQAEKQIKELQEKIQQLEERRRAREERERPRDERPDRPRRPRPGRDDDFGDPDGFDDGGPGFDDRGGERRDPIQRQIDRLQERIDALQPKAEQEREEREKLAEKRRIQEEERRAREALLAERRGAQGFGDEFSQGLGLGLNDVRIEEGATVRVYAADPTMQPGKTYRYKLLVSVINPLYAVPRLEDEQLAENQARAAILPSDEEIEAMEWISPIRVEPRSRFFFTSGNENQAKVDIYTRHKGVLQKKSFSVSPGDPIGGVITVKDRDELIEPFDVDMNVGAVLIDITRRRSLSGDTELTMIYMDAEGNLYERSQSEDINHADLRGLNSEVKDGPKWELRPEEDEEERFDDFGGPGFGGPGF